jgi:hypothetical protein
MKLTRLRRMNERLDFPERDILPLLPNHPPKYPVLLRLRAIARNPKPITHSWLVILCPGPSLSAPEGDGDSQAARINAPGTDLLGLWS